MEFMKKTILLLISFSLISCITKTHTEYPSSWSELNQSENISDLYGNESIRTTGEYNIYLFDYLFSFRNNSQDDVGVSDSMRREFRNPENSV